MITRLAVILIITPKLSAAVAYSAYIYIYTCLCMTIYMYMYDHIYVYTYILQQSKVKHLSDTSVTALLRLPRQSSGPGVAELRLRAEAR